MDARPSPEQRDLADAADRLARKLGPRAVGDLDDAERRARLDAALTQAGWRELRTGTTTEALANRVEAAIVARALARTACDTSFIGPVLAHDLARRASVEVDGLTIAVSSTLDRLASTTGTSLGSAATAIDVDGSTRAIVLVGASSDALATATITGVEQGVDLTRPIANLPAGTSIEQLVGAAPVSSAELTAWMALAITLSAADLVGAMEGAIELATAYAKDRRQYGAPIGSYQAVQHLLAEAATLTEGAASALTHAAWAVDALPPAAAHEAAAVAKAYAARAARTVCETAIQVHGGIGNTWECMAHVFLRRTLLATELFGSDGAQLRFLANRRWGATHGLS